MIFSNRHSIGRGEAVSKLAKMLPTEISALPKEPVDNWNYLHESKMYCLRCETADTWYS